MWKTSTLQTSKKYVIKSWTCTLSLSLPPRLPPSHHPRGQPLKPQAIKFQLPNSPSPSPKLSPPLSPKPGRKPRRRRQMLHHSLQGLLLLLQACHPRDRPDFPSDPPVCQCPHLQATWPTHPRDTRHYPQAQLRPRAHCIHHLAGSLHTFHLQGIKAHLRLPPRILHHPIMDQDQEVITGVIPGFDLLTVLCHTKIYFEIIQLYELILLSKTRKASGIFLPNFHC